MTEKEQVEDLELIEMLLEDGYEGVYAVSMVDKPAIESDWIALSSEKIELKVIDEEKRIVTGALLIPNQPITRKDPKTGKLYNIFFSADTINELSHKFMADHNNSNITLEHSQVVQNIDIVENWIKLDSEKDKSVALGIDVPIGSWLVTAKINNDQIWEDQIKTGKISGFSIEAQMQRKINTNLKRVLDMKENSLLMKLQAILKGVTPTEKVEETPVETVIAASEVEPVVAAEEEVPAAEGEAPVEEEEEKTYVTVEEFEALKGELLAAQQVLEAIVDYIGVDVKAPESAIEEPVVEPFTDEDVAAAKLKEEETVKASKEVEPVIEEPTFIELKAVSKSTKDHKLAKFDSNLTVSERIALNFKN